MAKRIGLYLPDDAEGRVNRLGRRRFGDSASAVVRYAVELADAILSDPATFDADNAAEALDAYARAHVADGRTAADVAESLAALAAQDAAME